MGNKKIDLTTLERKDLIQYCRDNNIDVRTKDDTKTILKKALKAIESASDTKVPDIKPKAAVAPKAASKAAPKKEVKKEVSKKTKKETKQAPITKSSSKPTKGQTVTVKKEKVSEEPKKDFVPVTFKSVGQNVIVIVDGSQYSKKEELKEEREKIKNLVGEINNSKDDSRKNALVNIFKEKQKFFEKNPEEALKDQSVEELLAKITDPALQEALASKLKVEVKKKVEEAPKTQADPTTRGIRREKPYR